MWLSGGEIISTIRSAVLTVCQHVVDGWNCWLSALDSQTGVCYSDPGMTRTCSEQSCPVKPWGQWQLKASSNPLSRHVPPLTQGDDTHAP